MCKSCRCYKVNVQNDNDQENKTKMKEYEYCLNLCLFKKGHYFYGIGYICIYYGIHYLTVSRYTIGYSLTSQHLSIFYLNRMLFY